MSKHHRCNFHNQLDNPIPYHHSKAHSWKPALYATLTMNDAYQLHAHIGLIKSEYNTIKLLPAYIEMIPAQHRPELSSSCSQQCNIQESLRDPDVRPASQENTSDGYRDHQHPICRRLSYENHSVLLLSTKRMFREAFQLAVQRSDFRHSSMAPFKSSVWSEE